MKNKILIKTLAVGVIFLFIGVAVAPSTAVNIPEKEEIEPKDYLFETIVDILNNSEVKSYLNEHKHDLIRNNNINYDCKNAVQKIMSEKPELLKTLFSTKPEMTTDYLETLYNLGLEMEKILGEEESSRLLKSVKNSNSESFNELKNIILSDEKLSNEISNLEQINRNFTIICLIIHYISFPIALLLYIVFEPYFVFMFVIVFKFFFGGDISNTELFLFLLGVLMFPIVSIVISIIELPFTILYNIFDCWDIVPEYPWYDT